jgi:hypothetical protein
MSHEPCRIEQSAVATDGDDEVGLIGNLVLGDVHHQVGGCIERVAFGQ